MSVLAISVYDLTDDQVDAIVDARRAATPACDTAEDSFWLGVLARRQQDELEAPRKAEDQYLRARRSCTRCGIDTLERELCTDCWDVAPDFNNQPSTLRRNGLVDVTDGYVTASDAPFIGGTP